jgi:hypothetical protein
MYTSWPLRRIGSMVIRINYTWLLVGALALWILALTWLPPYLADAPGWAPWALAAMVAFVYGTGLLLAEAVRTRAAGIFSAAWPRSVHLFPFGAATAYPLRGLGAGRGVVVALVAPLVLAALGAAYSGLATLPAPAPLVGALRALAALHLGAAALHALPGLPLAGGWALTALRGWASSNATAGLRLARALGLLIAAGLAAAGAVIVIGSGDWAAGLGLLALAWAVREGGAEVERRATTRQMLEELSAAQVMAPPGRVIHPEQNLAEVLWERDTLDVKQVLAVEDAAGRFVGLLPLAMADGLLQGTWPQTPVRAVMIPAAALPAVRLTTPLPAVLAALARRPPAAPAPADAASAAPPEERYVPVVEQDRLRGVISREQIAEYEQMGARVGVQEAAALHELDTPGRSRLAWAGALIVLFVGIMGLAALGNRVVGPTLAQAPTPTPVAGTITFADMTPAAGTIIGRGDIPVRVTIHSPASVLSVTLRLDGAPLAVTLDPPEGGTTVTATAVAPAGLLGLYTVAVAAQAEGQVAGSTQWSFRVAAGAGAGPGEPVADATPPPPAPQAAVTARYPAPDGLLPAGAPALDIYVDVTEAADGLTLALDGQPLPVTVQPNTPRDGLSRVVASVADLAPGPHRLRLEGAGGTPVEWAFTAQVPDAMHRFFPETGYFVSGDFLAFWEAHGGLPIFGYPLGDPAPVATADGTLTAQLFERARMEQPADGGAVRLGLLGLAVRPADPPVDARPGARYFPETGHNLQGPFLAYWEANGGLALFGYPVSEELQEEIAGATRTVQYFERARFEHHPEQAGTPWEVILSQLGRLVMPVR